MNHATRPLGRTGMEITLVGAGSWAAGGGNWKYGWGPQDDATSMRALRRALDGGVNWIDTAPVYGLGHSETIVGRVVRDMAATDRPLLFTKCGRGYSAEFEMPLIDPLFLFGEPVEALAHSRQLREFGDGLHARQRRFRSFYQIQRTCH